MVNMVMFQHLYGMTLVTMLHGVAVPTVVSGLDCRDWEGKVINEGRSYIPNKEDPCLSCTCQDGFAVMCKSVLCSPPNCEHHEPLPGECCMFKCIGEKQDDIDSLYNNTDFILPGTPETADTTNLGLRLVASTVTSFLILALLLFMVHRLRQRRLLIMMRRMNAQSEDDDAVAYMSHYDMGDMGIEFPPYEDPPPPYTPPKPPDIIHGDPPPPYVSTVDHQNNNEGERNGGPNTGTDPGNPTRPVQGMDPNGNIEPPQVRELQEPMAPNQPALVTEHRQGSGVRENPEIIAMHPVQARPSSRSPSLDTNPGSESMGSMNEGNYGLSVAVASVGETENCSSSPSHVIVRMHNNSPLSTLLRCEDTPDVMSAADMSLRRKHNSSPLTQFIKRSDSMEIKRGSNSPRNSFHMDGVEDETNHNGLGPCLPYGATESDRGNWSTDPSEFSCQGDVNSGRNESYPRSSLAGSLTSWIKGNKLFHVNKPNNTTFSQSDSASDHATSAHCLADVPKQNSTIAQNRRSKPPIDLGLSASVETALGTGANTTDNTSSTKSSGKNGNGKDGSSVSSSPSMEGAVGGYPFSYGHPEARNMYSPQYGPVCSTSGSGTPGTLSPPIQSPTHYPVRSGSLTSQFSVCSETGEKKQPKYSLAPVAIRNDMQYPLSPLSSTYVVPMEAPVIDGMSRSPSDVLDLRSSVASPLNDPRSSLDNPDAVPNRNNIQNHSFVPVSCESPESQQSLPVGVLDYDNGLSTSVSSASNMVSSYSSTASNGNDPKFTVDPSVGNTGHERPAGRNRICYVEPEDSDDAAPRSGVHSGPPTKLKSDKVKPIRSNSSGSNDSKNGQSNENSNNPSNSSVSPDENTLGSQGKTDKPSLRKLKQKKRRSLGSNPDKDVNNGNVNDGTCLRGSSQSPHRRRRISQGWDSNATYKQYGFIDDPELINGRESGTSHSGSAGPSPKLKSRSSSGDNSCNSKDRRDRSKERSRENSGERTNSRGMNEHNRDNCNYTNSNEKNKDSFRKRESPEHRRRCQQLNSQEQGTVIGDAENNMKDTGRRPHPQNSASLERERRRKRRSTGERFHPDSNGVPNGSLPMQEKDILQPMENGPQEARQNTARNSPGRDRQRHKKRHHHRHSLPTGANSHQPIDR